MLTLIGIVLGGGGAYYNPYQGLIGVIIGIPTRIIMGIIIGILIGGTVIPIKDC